MTLHHLLHVADCIRQNGPLLSYSQFPCERMIGRLKRSISSDSHPYTNLINNTRRRQLIAPINDATKFDTQARYVPKIKAKSVMVTSKSQLYGPMKHLPFDELRDDEKASMRECYSEDDMSRIFRLNEGQVWYNFQAENGDKIGCLHATITRTKAVKIRRFAKVSLAGISYSLLHLQVAERCAAKNGSRFGEIIFLLYASKPSSKRTGIVGKSTVSQGAYAAATTVDRATLPVLEDTQRRKGN